MLSSPDLVSLGEIGAPVFVGSVAIVRRPPTPLISSAAVLGHRATIRDDIHDGPAAAPSKANRSYHLMRGRRHNRLRKHRARTGP